MIVNLEQLLHALCRQNEPESPLFGAVKKKDIVAVRAAIDSAKAKGQVRPLHHWPPRAPTPEEVQHLPHAKQLVQLLSCSHSFPGPHHEKNHWHGGSCTHFSFGYGLTSKWGTYSIILVEHARR